MRDRNVDRGCGRIDGRSWVGISDEQNGSSNAYKETGLQDTSAGYRGLSSTSKVNKISRITLDRRLNFHRHMAEVAESLKDDYSGG